ncbi:MAG: hypothetical protein ACU85V_17490, partial [Gammaproteobacteria bacterium]
MNPTMMMTTTIRPPRFLAAAALLFASLAVLAEAEIEFSEAERRLWMTDQLSAVESAMDIRYRFSKEGSLEPGFADEVTFSVNKLNEDGTKSASLEFFTGERNFPVPPVDSTTVNPILKVYLQGDVYEMNRLTDPDGTARERWRYFQRRIKFALADDAVVEPASFEFDGRTYDGHRITLTPYSNDPRRDLFEQFA